MTFSSFVTRYRHKIFIIAAGCGTAMQLSFSGCDESLRDSLLTGVQTALIGLVSTFIEAFFNALMTPEMMDAATNVV
jgi:hypothetical protein